MFRKIRNLLILLFFSCMLFSIQTEAKAVLKSTATTICSAKTSVHVRKGPGLKYPIKKTIRKGQTVTKIGVIGNWSVVQMNASKYYIKSKYLKKLYKYVYVSASNVNLRTGPGTNYKVKKTLPRNTRLKCTGTKGNWLKINYQNKICYISKVYTSKSKVPVPSKTPAKSTTASKAPTSGTSASSATIRAKAIAAAKKRLGDRYSQTKRNLPGYADCSSLTRDAFLAASGVNIGETTNTQISRLVRYKKSLSSLQPGDVLMRISPGNNHAAIYIGSNRYIHASSTRKYVITSIYSPSGNYWTCCYDAAAYCQAKKK